MLIIVLVLTGCGTPKPDEEYEVIPTKIEEVPEKEQEKLKEQELLEKPEESGPEENEPEEADNNQTEEMLSWLNEAERAILTKNHEEYEKYIDTFEFYAPKALDKEAAIYRVYAENKNWPGNLNLLIDFLYYDFDNRLFYDAENFAERRMNCKQKCLSDKSCHYCETQFSFVENTLKKYQEYKNGN